MKVWKVAVVLLAAVVTMSAQAGQSADEKKICDLEKAWSQAAGSKNLDKTVAFYAEDASMMPYNGPIATGTKAIRAGWQGLMATPGFGLSFGPTKVEVAKSGDLAYDMGTFELKENDAKGKPTTTVGKYVVVWRKVKGEWKVVADIFNTDK